MSSKKTENELSSLYESNDGFRSRSHSEAISASAKDTGIILKSIDDIKTPFEEEAENTILRAIEAFDLQKEEESRNGTRDTSLGILTGVPAEAIHLFSSTPLTANGTLVAPEHIDAPLDPTCKPPGMTEIVQRMRMIKMRNSRHLNVTDDNVGTENNCILITRDPESLQRMNSSDESSYESNSGKEYKSSIRQTSNHVKSLYRRFCNPCYSLTSFIYIRWKDIKYFSVFLLYTLVPLLGISGILFYWGGNPMGPMEGSWSWWLIFVARIFICLVLAQLTQFIIIDFICLETQIAVRVIGRILTLMAMQAKGWPVLSIFWSMWQLILLHGPPSYNRHWLYRQNVFKIFNEINPPATITTNIWYLRLLIAMIILGVAVMFKRVYVSISLGKKKYVAYGPQMESIMRKVLLIAEVAMLAEDIEYSTYTAEQLSHKKSKVPSTGAIKANLVGGGWLFSDIRRESVIEDQQDEAGSVYSGTVQREPDDVFQIDDVSDRNVAQGPSILVKDDDDDDNTEPNTFATKLRRQIFNKSILKKESKKIFNESERIAIEKLLGEWEEPELYKKASWKDTSIQKILEFRETLNYMDGGNPLSVPFGPASTRKECLKSSQKVYHKLLLQSPENQILHFEKLLVLAVDKKGKLNKTKARALIRLFRPDRKGNLTLLDFVRSCDHLYKKVKMFRATTANATQLDDALENLLNVAFYTILTVVILLVMQVDFLTVFSTLAGIILPLSFLFSTAASLYFQGVLLVLVRQPYDIGDRIALSKPENDTDKDGSTSWFVEQISLFSTTVRNAATNEVATYSNSSLAPLRIINAARSPKAVKTLRLKFAIDVSLDKIKLFGASVEEFVKERPREWIKMACFRPTLIEADLGFVQYIVVLQHQESWQSIGSIKKSLADVASFCLELSKKLEMKYHTPPMPVNLSLAASMHPDGADPIVPTDIIGGGAFLNESNVRQSKDTISQIMNLFPRSPRSSNEKKVT